MKTSIAMRKSLVSATVFMSLSAVSALAYASNDSFIEVQYAADAFRDIAFGAAATLSDFCPEQVELPSGPMLVDHFAFPEPGTFLHDDTGVAKAINGFTTLRAAGAVLYMQPVEVHLKTLECAHDSQCSTTSPVSASLIYEFYMNRDSVCMRNHSVSGLPGRITPPGLDVCFSPNADTYMLTAGLPSGTVSGSAVSLSADGSRLAARIELGRTQADYDESRVAAWQRFVNGDFETIGAYGDVNVFVHKTLIFGGIQKQVADKFASYGVTSDTSGEASWTSLGDAGAQISVRMSGALSSPLCPEARANDFVLTATVDENIVDGVDGAATALRVRGSVSYDGSNTDSLCGLAGSLKELILGSVVDSIPLDLGPNCSVESDLRFSCAQAMPPQFKSVGPLYGARSEFVGVVGMESGLVLSSIVKAQGSSSLTMAGATSRFSYDKQADAYASSFRVTGTGKLCGVDFWASNRGDASLFVITEPSLPRLPYKVELPVSNSAEYASAPFHLMATVRTSAGVATYELPDVDVAQ